MSIGFSAALSVYSNQSIFRACTQSVEIRPDIAQMCIDVGARMVSESKTLLTKVLGYALQKKVLTTLGEETKADKMDKLLNANSFYSGLETKAIELATIEAIRLSRNPDYDPCPKNR